MTQKTAKVQRNQNDKIRYENESQYSVVRNLNDRIKGCQTTLEQRDAPGEQSLPRVRGFNKDTIQKDTIP